MTFKLSNYFRPMEYIPYSLFMINAMPTLYDLSIERHRHAPALDFQGALKN